MVILIVSLVVVSRQPNDVTGFSLLHFDFTKEMMHKTCFVTM